VIQYQQATDLHFIDRHRNQLVENQSDFLSLVLVSMTTEPVSKQPTYHMLQRTLISSCVSCRSHQIAGKVY